MLIIDSSALVKYIAKEEGWKNVEKILLEGVFTLELALKEAANALWKRVVKFHDLSKSDAASILKKLENIVKIAPQNDLLCSALEIAIEDGITVYDALYIAAAIKFKATLVTADRKQAEIAEKRNVKVITV